jgi:hypothetical protein
VSPWLVFLTYAVIAILTMFLTWPFLWEDPIRNFVEVFRLMSDNPTNLSVLFGGEVYRAGELPRRYLPMMLATTLTEPVWLLFTIGVVTGYWKLFTDRTATKSNKLLTASLALSWFIILVLYVLIRRPAMYDGIRHFLFILPPIFIFTGFAFDFLLERIAYYWLYASIVLLLLLPGITAMIQLHPYQYTYYNSFIGGTEAAFRKYETDYWLTCYKEAVEKLNETQAPIDLFVHREAYIADYYANENLTVRDLRGAVSKVGSGDYVLVNTRTNEDRRVFRDASDHIQIQRGQAIFCVVKRIP